jgi:SAM-dependent methyltransferase
MLAKQSIESIRCSNLHEQTYFDLHKYRYIDTLGQLPLQKIRGAVILDVGSLPCHLPVALLKMGAAQAIGLDHAPNRFNGQQELEERGMKLFTCDVASERFPQENDSADVCLCNEVIEHFEVGAKHCIQEMKRVTKKDGFILITTPNVKNFANRIRKLLRKPLYSPEKGLEGKQLHHYEYTMPELLELLEDSGLTIIRSGYIAGSEKALIHGTFPTRLPRALSALYALFPLMVPSLRSYLVVLAKKS